MFAAFKKIWSQQHDQWVSNNPFASFGKTAWVSVWTATFSEAMTESTIKSSFQKTGIMPFDPSIIMAKMMAPSIQHSSHGELPLPLTSPCYPSWAQSDMLTYMDPAFPGC